jgi:hypothetical protein
MDKRPVLILAAVLIWSAALLFGLFVIGHYYGFPVFSTALPQ